MLKNAYFLAKIGADTAENERHFAENLPRLGRRRAQQPPLRADEDRLLPLAAHLRLVQTQSS